MKIDDQLEKKILSALGQYADENELIVPKTDPSAPTAYSYDQLAEHMKETDATTIDVLETLYDRGFLKRLIHDRLFLCNVCQAWHVNLRETCPSCHSLDWQKKTLYHHFSCGYVGLEDEFTSRSFNELHCPKCEEKLRHIGMDYEKPTQPFYCNSCTHIFTEHRTEGNCLACTAVSEVDELIVKSIYRYELTNKAYQALERNSLKNASLGDLLEDQETGTFTMDYVNFALERQREVAQECGDAITVMVGKCGMRKSLCGYANDRLRPSFLMTFSQEHCLVCATRGTFEQQKETLLALAAGFQKENETSISANIYRLDLAEKAAPQLARFVTDTANRLSNAENPEE
jgi:hypothetical protein